MGDDSPSSILNIDICDLDIKINGRILYDLDRMNKRKSYDLKINNKRILCEYIVVKYEYRLI